MRVAYGISLFMLTTSVLYDVFKENIFQIAFLVIIPWDCLKSERAMVSSGEIDNFRPVLFAIFILSCLKINLTFVIISLYTSIEVFITKWSSLTARLFCIVAYLKEKVEFRNSK